MSGDGRMRRLEVRSLFRKLGQSLVGMLRGIMLEVDVLLEM
jgi:hypothetical protein